MKKILFVLTSHEQLGETGEQTGVWLEEAVNPYYQFLDANFEVTLTSPRGGKAPIDARSTLDESQTEATRRFFNDPKAKEDFQNTIPLEQIKSADDYDALFLPGGHGPMWDLCQEKLLAKLIEEFDRANKIIAAVCHGPAGLVLAAKQDGTPFVAGKKLTCFSNTEETAVGLQEVVPFLLETRLCQLGAKFVKKDDFQDCVVRDGNLITGQNPASSTLAAKTVISSLSLTTVASLDVGPGNITLAANGRLFLSLHQFYQPEMPVAELVDDRLESFPKGSEAERITLDTVLGIQCDANGWLWSLDNGNQSASLPKLVAWDTKNNKLAQVIYLPSPITIGESFVNDLAIDLTRNTIYISDPVAGPEAALIRVDLNMGLAQRILQGDRSVIPDDLDLIVDGVPVQIQQPDGTLIRPHLGVNGLVLDVNNEWLYFCPMHSNSMYRIKSEDLSNFDLSDVELAERVERYSDKPICDGISIDRDNNIYVGDLAANGIGVIKADRSYQLLIADEKISWIDSFSFGPDGYLYCNSNQLHRSAPLNAGNNTSTPPYHILKLLPFAPGFAGR